VQKLTTLEAWRDDDGNEIVASASYEKNVAITFRGRNNRLVVADGCKIDKLSVVFDCDNGTLSIGHNRDVKGGLWGIRVGQDATVTIGDNVSCTGVCIVSAVEGVTVRIGNDVMIASQNQVRADDGHPIFDIHTGKRVNEAESIRIGDHVWLALGSTVLAGGKVGDGTVIGYNSLVTGTIPNNCIAVGSPARVVRRDIAWERPHLSFAKPYYKPDASTVRASSRYWNPTVDETPPARRRSPGGRLPAGRVAARRLIQGVRHRLRRS
jgi:acetyltransferase-like isoleucine patch superfamily enzyme